MTAAALGFGCAAQGTATGGLGDEPPGTTHEFQEMRAVTGEILNWDLEGEWYVSPHLDAEEGATRVGAFLTLTEPGAMPRLEAQLHVLGDPMGDWVALGEDFAEEEVYVALADLPTYGDGARLRVHEDDAARILQLQWSAVVPEDATGEEEDLGDGEVGGRRDALRADLAGIGIITREEWGARRTRCTSRNSTKNRVAIHHTVTPSSDPGRQVRGAQAYHMGTRGWCDIGYHFLVSSSGHVYEGRPVDLLGAHVGGHNTGNVGIAFVGCHHSSGCRDWGPARPTLASVNAAGRLLGRLSEIYGISIGRSRVMGHRQHSGSSTSCPGQFLLERIPDILRVAADGSGVSPADPPGGAPPSGGAGSCTHSFGGTYAAGGCSAGYQCCDGRWRERGSGTACGVCTCMESTGTSGCAPSFTPPEPAEPAEPAPVTPPDEVPEDACVHSYRGVYGHGACSADYQCCNGRWKTRASGICGIPCSCVEPSGLSGCGLEPEEPTPGGDGGASCGHTYGGIFESGGCSRSWQCCDGAWTEGHGNCGSCTCMDEGGTAGCGGSGGMSPPPAEDTGWLTQSGSEIPRRGLANGTLRSTLGVGTEPYGDVVSAEGRQWVQGRVSWFGGPEDHSIPWGATMAITGENARSLNSPVNPSADVLRSRPADYYWIAMRWDYSPNGREFWRNARFYLRNPRTGRKIVVRAVDWGPHTRTGRILDLSPQAIRELGLSTDQDAQVSFAPPGTPLGPVR